MSNSLSTNSFSAARAAATIPTTTPQIGDTEEMLLAKQLKASAAVSGGGAPAIIYNANLTITLGGTSQVLQIVNAARRGVEILNTSAGDLWVQITDTPAGVNQGLKIAAGQAWTSPPQLDVTALMQIWGATTGQTFYIHTY